MRIGETLARSIFNCNLKESTMLINNTLTIDEDEKTILGEHTKTFNRRTGIDRGIREFTINNVIREIVLEQKQQGINNIYGLLFWDNKDNTFVKYTEINSWITRLNEKYKITNKEFSSHTLRRTRITEWRKQGMDMAVIQYLVGHVEASDITDKIYTTVDKEFVEQEWKKVN